MGAAEKTILVIVAMVLLLLSFGSGLWVADYRVEKQVEDLLRGIEVTHKEFESTRNKNTTLVAALKKAGDESTVLKEQIVSLQDKPSEIKYIMHSETILEGAPAVTSAEPTDYVFRFSNGLPVAAFEAADAGFQYNVASLTLNASLVISQNQSVMSLIAISDMEPDKQYELPIEELHVQHIQERKLFNPNLILLGSRNFGSSPITHVGLSAVLLHPRADLSLVGLRLSAPSGSDGLDPILGFDPIYYNIGDRLPVITNLWVGAGVSTTLDGAVSPTLSIGGKL